MMPELTTCPASDVPAALIVTPIFSDLANERIFLRSPMPLGQTTAVGCSL